MKICIVGLGYVGFSLSILLSRKYDVVGVDISKEKVDAIYNRISPIVDKEFVKVLRTGNLSLRATTDLSECFDADYVILSLPTNYKPENNCLDTSVLDEIIKKVSKYNHKGTIVIKSTIGIGYTKSKYNEGYHRVMFSPEFLREGKSLIDNLHPSRIIVGIPSKELMNSAKTFVEIMKSAADEIPPTFIIGSSEAEAIKLFSNTYLAMRVAFFNELDSFAEKKGMDPAVIIKGMSFDSRIGDYYNNPSFGYGGYCLPKDTKQLLYDFDGIVNKDLMTAIVESNESRKQFIVENIIRRLNGKKKVGIYRLIMKAGSDNFRESSIIGVIEILNTKGIEIMVYEPLLDNTFENTVPVENDIKKFVSWADLIVANRKDKTIETLAIDKLYSRDLFLVN